VLSLQPRSILSNYVLNPYWNWLVEQWPRWVAPNTVSVSWLQVAPPTPLSIHSIDHVLRVLARRVQLCDDALLRPGVLDREGRCNRSTPVDLLHVRSPRFPPSPERAPCRATARPRAAESPLPFYSPAIHLELTNVRDHEGGPPDCSYIRALTRSMGKRGFHPSMGFVGCNTLMYWLERA
jgi:hypothetical protein